MNSLSKYEWQNSFRQVSTGWPNRRFTPFSRSISYPIALGYLQGTCGIKETHLLYAPAWQLSVAEGNYLSMTFPRQKQKNHEWIHECPSSNTGFCLQNFNHDKVLDLLDIELLIRFCWWHADKTLPYLIYQFTPKTTRRKVTKIRCLGNLVVDGMGMCCLDLDVPFYHFYQRSFARHQPAELAGMAREYSVYAARWIAKLVNPPGCWRDGEHDTMGWLRDDRTMFFSIRRMKGWSLLACKRNV
jgi:hypothetical protein